MNSWKVTMLALIVLFCMIDWSYECGGGSGSSDDTRPHDVDTNRHRRNVYLKKIAKAQETRRSLIEALDAMRKKVSAGHTANEDAKHMNRAKTMAAE